mmetsp:Transcript_22203/g.37689  ORF Transcript_22203/g.37689 Transcript_22203/m.37689 type:complete len:218 (-) Transcript_22203:272-925(-)
MACPARSNWEKCLGCPIAWLKGIPNFSATAARTFRRAAGVVTTGKKDMNCFSGCPNNSLLSCVQGDPTPSQNGMNGCPVELNSVDPVTGKLNTTSESSCRMYSALEKLSAHKLVHCPMSFHNRHGRPPGDQSHTSCGTPISWTRNFGSPCGKKGLMAWASCRGTTTWMRETHCRKAWIEAKRNGRSWRSDDPENRRMSAWPRGPHSESDNLASGMGW